MLVVIIKERQTDLTWMFHCITASWSPGAGTSGIVKGGMYIHELERIPKDGLTCIQLKRNCGILPRSTDTTSPPFLVRKITIGDIHFPISISFSISSSLLNVFSSGWVSSNVFECS